MYKHWFLHLGVSELVQEQKSARAQKIVYTVHRGGGGGSKAELTAEGVRIENLCLGQY